MKTVPEAPAIARGPYFEELSVGQVFDSAPDVTLTEGFAASHQAIVGCRLRLPLSAPLAQRVTGHSPVADPALVWNVAIGQSTLVTQHVRANLFYRGLQLLQLPSIGDTLHTTTTVTELRQNALRAGRPATGLAVLHMVTVDQAGRSVLDFYRCAMIPLLDDTADTGHHAALTLGAADLPEDGLLAAVEGWNVEGPATALPNPGEHLVIGGSDVVSAAPELARLTLNIASVHHDAVAAGGRRLVYGGHTIALALTQAARALPDLLTVLGWHSCDHLAPVHEDDVLSSVLELERVSLRPAGGQVAHLRSRVSARSADGSGEPVAVLDWRFAALLP